ncbi:hypothetical protein LOTGIDRAFT_236477 [Lottia gigantea]|uniref:Coiled-coil domain-containing protein n=1 Tax=Lottia gigantea TaxID=225164 RepID=V3ZHE8_LOTGI|nr:hypothetical protein LOTGIDRAFT_236477 [Lottia gigantea]ESO83622.1 hypothetical protein LOTGIDRAFT_236477 [Lottia gigantea]
MADPIDGETVLPESGKVEKVCKEWLVHEDGAMAYKLQNEENDRHYGLNRFQRRTVRGDIPVAKLVQTEEEKRLQEEQLRKLERLKEQAENDAMIAKQVQEQEKQKAWQKNTTELDDEAIARLMQEKEKKKYERYLEKKKEKELKKKRERLEKELAEQSEQARVGQSRDTDELGSDRLHGSVDRLSVEDTASSGLNGHTRVRPGGQIEDDGDFSDFYALPPGDNTDPMRRQMQETQDEELARLLQEQEHKRTKAEVDKNKLKAIEIQDEELARVIHEQEKLKLRKAKQKRQQKLEQQSTEEPVRRPTDRSLPSPDSPPDQPPPYQHRYRRNSYTRSITNNPGPVQDSPVVDNYNSANQMSDEEQWFNQPDDSADLTSARELSQRANTAKSQDQNSHRFIPRGENVVPKSQQPSLPPRPQESRHNTVRVPAITDQLPSSEVPSVERWLADTITNRQPSNRGHALPPSPSPPGSYHSEEESPQSLEYHGRTNKCNKNNSSQSFNIAAAIDPTYKRRQHEIDDTPSDQTQQKALGFTRSLPIEDTEVEWDPAGLRGSLRRPKGQWNPSVTNYQESSTLSSIRSELDSSPDGAPVMNQWQPVQGQRRSTLDNRRKVSKPPPNSASNKSGKGGSCKQQ